MALCAVSGLGRTPAGVSVEGDVLVFFPQSGKAFRDSSGVGVVPKPVRVTVGAGGNVSVSLYTGVYILRSISQNGTHDTSFVVPNTANATFGECLEQVPSNVYSQIELAALAASGIATYATTGAGLAATPSGGFFMVPASPSGLNIYEDVGGVATLRGSLLNFQNVPQSSQVDQTTGRLLTVGAFGLGALDPGNDLVISDIDTTNIPAGFYRTISTTLGVFPSGENIFGTLLQLRYSSNNAFQIWTSLLTDQVYTRRYRSTDVPAWSPWRLLFAPQNILGTVSQTGGVPTGRVIQRGSNANGEFVRFADGTQICTIKGLTGTTVDSAFGSLFRGPAAVTWTFPAAFAAAPVVNASAPNVNCWASVGAAVAASVTVRLLSGASQGSVINLDAIAVGRWF